MTDQTLKDIDRAFKALEERDELLDKIESEIEQTYETDIGFLIHDGTKRTILNIIDKYRKAERSE